MADFKVHNHGSIIGIEPLSEEAKTWVAENVEVPDWSMLGSTINGDHRRMKAVIEGMVADGLEAQ